MKKCLAFILAIALLFGMCIPASAEAFSLEPYAFLAVCPQCGHDLIYQGSHSITKGNYRWVEHYDAYGNFLHDDLYYDEYIGEDYFCPNCVIVHCFVSVYTIIEHDADGLGR